MVERPSENPAQGSEALPESSELMENDTVDEKRAEEWLDENDYYQLADIERPAIIYLPNQASGVDNA